MRERATRRLRATGLILLPAAAWAAACAPVTVRVPGPEQVPGLEARLESDPSSTWTRVQLGAAYRARGDAALAVDVLEPALRSDADNPPAVLVLGSAYEDLGRFAEARALYSEALADIRSSRLRGQVQARLERVRREDLRAAVRAAVANEQALASQPPPAMTVGVFPFLVEAADTSLHPLSRGLAELLSTDLAMTDRLRVVERSQLQYLLDEIQLAASGSVQPETGARAGRMMGAANIVQGSIGGTESGLGLQAAVVAVTDPAGVGPPLREAGAIDRLFDMEKSLALAVFSRLGLELTVAERERVEQNGTRNVQALLAFGFGLEAMDAGRYGLAASRFARAVTLDPGFQLARQRQDEAARLDEADASGTTGLIDEVSAEFRLDLTEYQKLNERFAAVELLIPDPLPRDAAAEALQRESPIPGALLRIVIRRPGGSP